MYSRSLRCQPTCLDLTEDPQGCACAQREHLASSPLAQGSGQPDTGARSHAQAVIGRGVYTHAHTMATKRRFSESVRPVRLSREPVITGGQSKSKWMMTTMTHEGDIFVEVKSWSEWLVCMVHGTSRNKTQLKISSSPLWEHWADHTIEPNELEKEPDAFGDAVGSANPKNRRSPRKLRESGPVVVEVPWPDNAGDPSLRSPLTFLAHAKGGSCTPPLHCFTRLLAWLFSLLNCD